MSSELSNFAPYVQYIRIFTALIFNQEAKKLIELNVDDDSEKCTHCITACPLSTEIIRKATVSGNGLLVQKVYDDAENPTKVETDICDKPMTPSIVFDLNSSNLEIGYEMFYGKGQSIKLNCDLYNDLFNIINGKPNQHGRKFINHQSITKIDEDDNTTFQIKGNPDETTIIDGEQTQEDRQPINDKSIITTAIDENPNTSQIKDTPDETMVFYWISVLTLVNPERNRRQITIEKDVINDYFHKERVISHCENYYISVGAQIVPLERGCQIPSSKCQRVLNWLFSKQPAADKRLEKTQIVPMHMLHTLPGRLATCLYANIAFIWSSIANGQLEEVDLFLYALYKVRNTSRITSKSYPHRLFH
ncbi:uncharacterized protein LOC135848036 [Planococcus citri]|uniref:uncharacterized protein LOC135848036 n=1 Tax=Planococcus citri TaxID=170843 RepID=UPI0031F9B9B1